MQLKVLHIIASSLGGGAEAARCLIKGMDKSQFESVVVIPDDGGHLIAQDFIEAGAQVINLKIDAGFNWIEWWKLRYLIQRKNFNVIHVHGTRAALWGRIAAIGAKRLKTVFSPHGLSIVHYSGFKQHLLITIEKLMQTTTDITLCVSRAEQDDVLKWGLAPKPKTRVVYNGIDLERLKKIEPVAARTALNLPQNIPILLMVCRLNKPRDFETLIAGMNQIVHAYPDAKLLIAGDGPYRAKIESLVATYRLNNSIQLLGMVRDINLVYSAADIAVLITTGWEGLPLSVLEAMGMNLPVIASDVGGNREAVVDGETGFIIPPSDADSFSKAAIQLIADPALATKMGIAGKKRVEENFILQSMSAQVSNIYLSLQ